MRASALREDVEYQAGAIEHAARDHLFEVAFLRGGKFVIDDDQVRARARHRLLDLLGLALADKARGVRPLARAENRAAYLGAGGFRQLMQLFDLAVAGMARKTHMHQQRPFAWARARPATGVSRFQVLSYRRFRFRQIGT